jgi:hypothetical protein
MRVGRWPRQQTHATSPQARPPPRTRGRPSRARERYARSAPPAPSLPRRRDRSVGGRRRSCRAQPLGTFDSNALTLTRPQHRFHPLPQRVAGVRNSRGTAAALLEDASPGPDALVCSGVALSATRAPVLPTYSHNALSTTARRFLPAKRHTSNGPGGTRTRASRIRSPAEQAETNCSCRKLAASSGFSGCDKLQRDATAGDESVLPFVLSVVVLSGDRAHFRAQMDTVLRYGRLGPCASVRATRR